jgi:hypothetical protein
VTENSEMKELRCESGCLVVKYWARLVIWCEFLASVNGRQS